jgi:hypothetical protein
MSGVGGAAAPRPARGAIAAAAWSVAAAAIGLGVAVASVFVSTDPESGATPVSGWVAFGVATSILLFVFELRTLDRAREGVATLTATAAWVVVVLVGFEIEGDTLYRRGFDLIGPAPWLLLAAPLFVGTVFVASFWLSWRGRAARFDRLRRRLTTAVLAVTAAMTVLALARSRRPPPDAYLASLPVIGTVAVDAPIELPGGRKLGVVPDKCDPIAFVPGDASTAPGCRLRGIRSACVMCLPLTIRHDVQSDFYWLFYEERPAIVFKGTDVEARSEVRVRDLAGVVGPPVGWTLGAAFGVVMAVAFIARARSFARRGAALVASAEPSDANAEVSATNAASFAGDETAEALRVRGARLYALAATTCVLCAGPLLLGAALGRW